MLNCDSKAACNLEPSLVPITWSASSRWCSLGLAEKRLNDDTAKQANRASPLEHSNELLIHFSFAVIQEGGIIQLWMAIRRKRYLMRIQLAFNEVLFHPLDYLLTKGLTSDHPSFFPVQTSYNCFPGNRMVGPLTLAQISLGSSSSSG